MKCRTCGHEIGFVVDANGYHAVHLPANTHDRDMFTAGARWLRAYEIKELRKVNGEYVWVTIPPEISKSSQYRLRKKLEERCDPWEWGDEDEF